jgi:hypothetical protein
MWKQVISKDNISVYNTMVPNDTIFVKDYSIISKRPILLNCKKDELEEFLSSIWVDVSIMEIKWKIDNILDLKNDINSTKFIEYISKNNLVKIGVFLEKNIVFEHKKNFTKEVLGLIN